jgi:hypothetical protein
MLLAAHGPSRLFRDAGQAAAAIVRRSAMRASVILVSILLALPGDAIAEETWDELEPRVAGQFELDEALVAARPEIDACLTPPGITRATVSVRLGRRTGLRIRVRTRPHDVEVERCIDTAVRNRTTLLSLGRIIGRPASRFVMRRSGEGWSVR